MAIPLLIGLQIVQGISSIIGASKRARTARQTAAENIRQLEIATSQTLADIEEQAQESANQIANNVRKTISRIRVLTAESGFGGKTAARIRGEQALTGAKNLISLNKQKERVKRNAIINFESKVANQLFAAKKAKVDAQAQTINSLLGVGTSLISASTLSKAQTENKIALGKIETAQEFTGIQIEIPKRQKTQVRRNTPLAIPSSLSTRKIELSTGLSIIG